MSKIILVVSIIIIKIQIKFIDFKKLKELKLVETSNIKLYTLILINI